MPIIDKNDVTLGLGNLEFGEYDAQTGLTFQSYIDIGAIKADFSFTTTREVMDFESGRPLLVILQQVIRERVTVTATLAEIKLATLKMALGQGALSSGVSTSFLDGTNTALKGTLETGKTAISTGTLLKFGGSPSLSYIGIRFTHVKPDGKRIIFEGYKASPSGDLAMAFHEADWNLQQVTFRLLADLDHNRAAGEQYYQLFKET
jgi:hypothetical protein